jgi:hypothetical protein
MQKIIGLIAALVAGGSWLYVAPALADEPPGPALSLKFDKTGLHPGDTVTAFGTLQKPGSPPLAGQNVKVSVCWGELYGECRQTVTVTTDANGNYSAPFSLGDPVTGYPPRARAYFAGLGTAPNYEVYPTTIDQVLDFTVKTKLQGYTVPGSLKVGQAATVKGTLTSTHADGKEYPLQTVVGFQRKADDGSGWTDPGMGFNPPRAATDANGTFSITWTPTKAGIFRTCFNGCIASTLYSPGTGPEFNVAGPGALTVKNTAGGPLYPGDVLPVSGTLRAEDGGPSEGAEVQVKLCQLAVCADPVTVKTTANGTYTAKVRIVDTADAVTPFTLTASSGKLSATADVDRTVRIKAALKEFTAPESVTKGGNATITGRWTHQNAAGDQKPLPAGVELWMSPNGENSWSKADVGKAGADGKFSFTRKIDSDLYVEPRLVGYYEYFFATPLRITAKASTPTPSASPTPTNSTTPTPTPTPTPRPTNSATPAPAPTHAPAPSPQPTKAASKVSANAGPEPVKKGKKLTVAGQLLHKSGSTLKAYAHKKVAIYFKAKGAKKWKLIGWATTGKNGKYSIKITAKADGSWQTRFPGDAKNKASTSGSDYVDVR